MKLNHLSDKQLLLDMHRLVHQEREILVKVLWHLKEIDKRKLYADLKCKSLFDYAITVLKYSEGQASRRISACRLLIELPEIMPKIESGALNLTLLNQAAKHFGEEGIKDPKEKTKILNKIVGSTTRESDKILSELREHKPERPKTVFVELLTETFEELKKLHHDEIQSCPKLDNLVMKMISVSRKSWDRGQCKRPRVFESKSRYVPVGVRAEVWKRDNGVCRNCGSTYAIELDHKNSFAMGGLTTVSNLQLLCRNCNQRKGLKEFGYRKSKVVR